MADISMSQVDLFLTLYWNAEYKARVTTRLATVVMVTTKIVAALLASIMVLVDPAEFNCHNIDGRRFLCTYFIRRNNVFYYTIPICLCLIVVSFTSIYVFKVLMKHQASVSPIVNLQPTVNNLNHGANKDDNDKDSKNGEAFEKVNTVERQNSNPHLFYKVVSYHR